ncbi:MAG TPA: VWA domain-containing protein [Candidatus Dormibacteraeota bacterium]|jgi:VWFA-related protein|nr:VWA domain-containing protein [Candidatus Dormibacteraeota bacterium]
MKSHCVAARAFVLFSALFCVAQQPSVPQQESPITTLHADTRLILLDVVVTDKHGKPVRTLSKDDFTIQEEGDDQSTASFEAPSGHAAVAFGENLKSAGDGQSPHQPAKAMVSSALTILVLDELDTLVMDQAYARREIRQYLHAHGPQLPEPTALMALEEKRLELLHDYSSDANALEIALQRHPARLPFRLMTGPGLLGSSERLGDALEALREIAAANGQFAGRKNVIWIGAGFPSLNYLSAQPADKARMLGYVHETSDLMWRGRLAIYTLDPRGLEVVHENIGISTSSGFLSPPDSTTGDLVFEQLAPATGGRIFRGLNDLDAQIATSVEDGDSYYSLSYYPSNRQWNGGFRRIRVVMRNPELIARTRNGYYATPDSAPTDPEMDRLLSRAVINPLSYHSLQVQARARLSGSQPRTAHITVDIDANRLHWETPQPGKRRCELTVVTAGFSTNGKVAGHAVKELEVNVDERKYAELKKKGMVMNLAMELPPSAVRMRVVARDSTNGNMGTADLTPTGEQFH